MGFFYASGKDGKLNKKGKSLYSRPQGESRNPFILVW